jgi:hypothetical protein
MTNDIANLSRWAFLLTFAGVGVSLVSARLKCSERGDLSLLLVMRTCMIDITNNAEVLQLAPNCQ